MTIRVVFVCHGNICRSPMAEGVFGHMIREAGLQDAISIDSAGVSTYHLGEAPHRGTQKVLKKHGISYQHQARKLHFADLVEADYLIAMDESNYSNIKRMGKTEAEVGLLLDYAPETRTREVPDPYYSGGFDRVYTLVEAGCRGLLEHIRGKEGI